MKKNIKLISILAIVILLAVALTGCTADNVEQQIETNNSINKQEENNIGIEYFIKKLEEAGLKIDNKTKKYSQLIGADEGYGLEINGGYIEIYLFNVNSQDELTKSNIKSVKENGVCLVPSLDNLKVRAIYNKGLVLAGYEEHINRDKIVEIFKNL